MTTAKLKDSLGVSGTLRISCVDSQTGEIISPVHELNLITVSGKQSLLASLYTTSIIADPIATLRIGSGGCIDSGGLYPKPEDPYQTGLYTPISGLSLSVSHTVAVGGMSVTFIADVDPALGNGQIISEAGLFTNSGVMFNVKNHPGIPKSSAFSIHYEWTISIT